MLCCRWGIASIQYVCSEELASKGLGVPGDGAD